MNDLDIINSQDVTLRPMEEKDFGFVLKTFTQALHKSYPYNIIPRNIFFSNQTKILKHILQNGAQVTMASIKGNEDDLFGYIITDNCIPGHLIIHWIHVKDCWRGMSIAQQLLSHFDYQNKKIIVSICTDNFKSFREKISNMIYNPFLWAINL